MTRAFWLFFGILVAGGERQAARTGPAGVAQIRRHLEQIATSFQRGDFPVPGFVHDREVPGTKMMSARAGHGGKAR